MRGPVRWWWWASRWACTEQRTSPGSTPLVGWWLGASNLLHERSSTGSIDPVLSGPAATLLGQTNPEEPQAPLEGFKKISSARRLAPGSAADRAGHRRRTVDTRMGAESELDSTYFPSHATSTCSFQWELNNFGSMHTG